MCYDIKVLHETALKRARRKNDPELISIIEKELEGFDKLNFHHVSGYSHPKLPIYTSLNPNQPKLVDWGLIPFWIKDEQSAKRIQNSTLNARAESLHEKPAFRKAAKNQHCLLFVDGFYEHHHFQGKTFPFYIQSIEPKPLCLAGVWDEWVNPETGEIYKGFSIVTTKGNALLKKIHNNPKLAEARMPLVLDEAEEEIWLTTDFDKNNLEYLLKKQAPIHIKAHTVRKLRGKTALGNVKEVSDEYVYPELSSSPEFEF